MSNDIAAQAKELVIRLADMDSYMFEESVELVSTALVAAKQQGRAESLEQSLAIYEKGFAENWVVQDVIDAIRALKKESQP